MSLTMAQTATFTIDVIRRAGDADTSAQYIPDDDQIVINVGRDRAWSHIQLSEPIISLQHLIIRRHTNRYDLIDNNSTNGIYVDQQRIPSEQPYPVDLNEKLVYLGSPSHKNAVLLRIFNINGETQQQPDLIHDAGQMRFFLRNNPVKLTNSGVCQAARGHRRVYFTVA